MRDKGDSVDWVEGWNVNVYAFKFTIYIYIYFYVCKTMLYKYHDAIFP